MPVSSSILLQRDLSSTRFLSRTDCSFLLLQPPTLSYQAKELASGRSTMVAPVVIASAGLGMLAGVAMANRSLGDGLPAASRWDARPRCPTCGGSGRVKCMCNRWSDGDSGCRTCAGSGRMPCRSCGGSGTGRPLPARLIVQNNQKPPPYN